MYWKFINLRIIIELCGFIVVFWLVELQPVLNLATSVPRHLPHAATSPHTWQPHHLPPGRHCHIRIHVSSQYISMSDVAS
jgi:hypothetical protein